MTLADLLNSLIRVKYYNIGMHICWAINCAAFSLETVRESWHL